MHFSTPQQVLVKSSMVGSDIKAYVAGMSEGSTLGSLSPEVTSAELEAS